MLKNNIEMDVKMRCIEKSTTQAKIAENIGTSPSYVNKIVRSKEQIMNKTFLAMMEDLGFDASLFPGYATVPSAELRNRVLNDVVSPEFSDSEPAGLLPRVAWKYRRWNANAWKQELCYGDSRLKSFVNSVWSHLLKPSSI